MTAPVFGFNQFRERAEQNRASRQDRERRALEVVDARGRTHATELAASILPPAESLQQASRSIAKCKWLLEKLERDGLLVSELVRDRGYLRRWYRRAEAPPA
jgi:hypothetical protein